MPGHDDEAAEPDSGSHDRNVAAGVVVVAFSAGIGAVRLALRPARLLARGPLVAPFVNKQTDRLADVGDEASTRVRKSLEAMPERVVDQVFADVDSEAVASAAVDGVAAERIARQVLASPALERILLSPEGQHLLEQIAASPAVRKALLRQSTGFLDETVQALRAAAERLDSRLARRPADGPYAGVATRAVALGVDAAIGHVAYLIGAAFLALVASLVGGLGPGWFQVSLATGGWLLVMGTYFVGFWTLTGQTLGMRLMGVRVGRPMHLGRAVARFIGLVLAIAPLFAGFASVPFDRKRRGLPDFIAGTAVVRDEPGLEL